MHPGSPPSCPRVGDLGSRGCSGSCDLGDGVARLHCNCDCLDSLSQLTRPRTAAQVDVPRTPPSRDPCRASVARPVDVVDLHSQPRRSWPDPWPARIRPRRDILVGNRLQRLGRVHPQHQFVVAAHADVGLTNAVPRGRTRCVSCGRVGMGADHAARPPVDDDSPCACFSLVASAWKSTRMASAASLEPTGLDLALHGAERAVELRHEDEAHGVDDQHVGAVARP